MKIPVPFLFLLFFLLGGVLPAAHGETVDADTVFIQDMLAARRQFAEQPPAVKKGFKTWYSAEVSRKTGPVAVDLDVSAVDELNLNIRVVGDNYGAQTVWGEPVLVDAAGAETPLGRLPFTKTQVGWSAFAKDRYDGKPLSLGGREMAHGLFAHAPSSLSVKLGRKYVRFRALAGINDTGSTDAAVIFEVANTPSRKWELDLLEKHGEMFTRFQSDFGGGWDRWFKVTDTDPDRALIESVIKPLGRSGKKARAKLAKLVQEKAPWSDPRWLRLYLAHSRPAVKATSLIEDAESVEKAAVLLKKVRPELDFSKEVAAVKKMMDTIDMEDVTVMQKAHDELRQLRRRILFSHPALAFDRLLVNVGCPPQYSHNVDQYLGRHSKTAPGLVVLKDWKSANPELTWLTRDVMPPGAIRHPDLSYDAKRILFAYSDHRPTSPNIYRFFVYEMPLDGSAPPRQITGTAADPMVRDSGRYTVLIEDFDPTYLPDGGFVFTSTRTQSFGRCHGGRYTPSFYLYRGELDGSGIRMLSYGEANEITPSVLNDGRIVYNRWDYINRHDCQFHKLWSTNPDGTATANFWGNLTNRPLSVAEPRAIPGTNKIICTATAHHSFTAGTILLVDTTKGDEGEDPFTHLTPEVPYPEAQGYPATTYATPYPLTEDLFFAAYSSTPHVHQGQVQRDDAYSICLVFHVDGKAYREPIFNVAGFSCWAPTPVIPRQPPPVIPSRLEPGAKPWGTFFVRNVYESTQPIPKNSVKWLRVNEILNQPAANHAQRSVAMNENTKRVLGTVPVEPDGSVAFHAPAGKRLQFQLLDQDKMAVMTMRTFVYLQPGEFQGCVGCHESRRNAPHIDYATVEKKMPAVRELTPPPGPAVSCGFSYVAQVQPVLDRHCISCHGLAAKPAGGVNLLGSSRTEVARFNESYLAMVHRPGFVKILPRNKEPSFSTPKQAFAACSKLPALLKKHHGVNLDADEWERVITWLDVNCQFYGNYSFNRLENRTSSPEGEKALRAAVAKRFGEKIAAQPLAALVNNLVATESRILKAPLAVKSGGWGQLANGWTSTQDAGYQEMLRLVEGALTPLPFQDSEGTCGRGPKNCICNSCWVKPAELEFHQQLTAPPVTGTVPANSASKTPTQF